MKTKSRDHLAFLMILPEKPTVTRFLAQLSTTMSKTNTSIAYHLALPVKDLGATMRFYQDVLGCTIGRTSYRWVDVNFFGHQITFHEDPARVRPGDGQFNASSFPVFHFGAILSEPIWNKLFQKLKNMDLAFEVEPKTVFPGETGEQKTYFITDPSGYYLEFKTFSSREMIFKT